MGRQPFLITIPKLDPGKVKGKEKKKVSSALLNTSKFFDPCGP